jgi:crotonobetainyl-CoA:carnitine CoA-transferase CaiB-like acyl-CoA transferase
MNNNTPSAWQPLAGLKIIDFSMLLPGPLTTLIFADLGAEIIKVEPPGGDYARGMGSNLFAGANRNKRSIVLDLKQAGATQVIEKLAAYGDVAIEGFRPGVAERLGIAAATLQNINPALIYCSLSGFGQSGPMKDHSGHDLAYLAMAGSLSQSGHWREPSRRSSTPVADMAGGANAAIAILAALHESKQQNKGRVIDISLYESILYMNAIRFGFELDEPTKDHLYPTNDLFRTQDDELIALTIVEEKFWRNFVQLVSHAHPEFSNEQYNTEAGRREHGDRLMDQLDKLIQSKSAKQWLILFNDADVPAALSISPGQSLRTEQSQARAWHVQTADGPVFPFPAIADQQPASTDQAPPPGLGQHSAHILQTIGFKPEEIDRLINSGVVQQSVEKQSDK